MRRFGTIDARAAGEEQQRRVDARLQEVATVIGAIASSEPFDAQVAEAQVVELACAAELGASRIALHLQRVGRYVALLASALEWPDDRVEMLRLASLLHDVGKAGLPDEVLLSDGLFTRDDRSRMEPHAEIGHALLVGHGSELLDVGARVALSHHERVDGTGYPKGLRAHAIPLESRIVAIADVFDALTTERRYKPAMNLIQARALMMANRGAHFDAVLLDLFFERTDDLLSIRRRWTDPHRRLRARSSPGGG